jgi:hypothetical protein
VPFRGMTRPFQSRDGTWWFSVKPLFAWPVDFFVPSARIGIPRPFLVGAQWPVGASDQSNSTVCMNVIHDLQTYGFDSVAASKRRAIRKGLAALDLERLDPGDPRVQLDAWEVWSSHVQRTGWNRAFSLPTFAESWKELSDWPGTAVFGVRDRVTRALCSWTIARAIGSCLYIDTLATHTDRLAHRPNDLIIFEVLGIGRLAGLSRAHYSLQSQITSLEEFKKSIGFVACDFPCRLHLRAGVGPMLKVFAPRHLLRLRGDPSWQTASQASGVGRETSLSSQ